MLFGWKRAGGARSVEALQARLSKAAAELAAGNTANAAKAYEGIIAQLGRAEAALTYEQRQCLAEAYLGRGRCCEAQSATADALAAYAKARELGVTDRQSVSLLAEERARQGDASEPAMRLYVEHLTLQQSAGLDPLPGVMALLQQACRIEMETPAVEARRRLDLNLQLATANPAADWVQANIGFGYLVLGQEQDALVHLERAYQLNPTRSEARYELCYRRGLSASRAGRTQDAVADLREAVRVDPARSEALFALGRLLVEPVLGDPSIASGSVQPEQAALLQEGAQLLQQALDREPRSHECAYLLGSARGLLGDHMGAVAALERAASLLPANPDYQARLGIELEATGDRAGAKRALVKAVSSFGGSVTAQSLQARRTLGAICLAEGDMQTAASHFRAVLERQPADEEARLALGRALFETGAHEQSLAELSKAQGHSYAKLFYTGRCCSKLGRPAEAVAAFESLLRSGSAALTTEERAATCYWLGCAYGNSGQAERAVAAFSEALKLEPGNTRARLQRAHAYYAAGRRIEAMHDYAAVAAAEPGNATAHYVLGRLLAAEGKTEQARAELKAAVGADPGHGAAQLALGIAREAAGDLDGAVAAYEAALPLQPATAELHARLGAACLKRGDAEKALEYLARARDMGDDSDFVLFHLGAARVAKGEIMKGLSDWEQLRQRRPEDEKLLVNIARAHYMLGQRLAVEGRHEEAILELLEYLRVYRTDETTKALVAELYFRTAACAIRRGTPQDLRKARTVLERAADMDEGRAAIPYYLAICDLAEGNDQAAAERLTALVKDGMDEMPDGEARVQHRLALALIAQGQVQEAAEVLGRLPSEDGPWRVRVLTALAMAHTRAGRWSEAADVLLALAQPEDGAARGASDV